MFLIKKKVSVYTAARNYIIKEHYCFIDKSFGLFQGSSWLSPHFCKLKRVFPKLVSVFVLIKNTGRLYRSLLSVNYCGCWGGGERKNYFLFKSLFSWNLIEKENTPSFVSLNTLRIKTTVTSWDNKRIKKSLFQLFI